MDQIFTFFNQGWVASLIAIIGIPIAYFIAKHVRHKGKPCYQRYARVLLGGGEDDLPSEVSIKYDGDDVKKLTRTSIIFWNHGTEILNGEDIVLSDPLRLEFPSEVTILNSKIIKETKSSNEFELKQDEENKYILYLSYVYLDPRDGVSFEILHDGEMKYPKFEGVIKGIPKGVFRFSSDSLFSDDDMPNFMRKTLKLLNKNLMYLFLFISGAVVFLTGFLVEFFPEFSSFLNSNQVIRDGVGYMVLGVLYILLPTFMIWDKRIKYPKSLKLDR
ncbi:hypothetical protein [Marinomonas profundimaris]|uniref:Uncharacterized protein n=1 Tax=Marinomonas profundimaris TaxID=1208321 RepID=W1RUF0_9GAMM|nr:hypothetical protein [Marinomonas profundimaris]ETI60836.1 hypothetical protein D104_08140 [Marinomonas profundimaris]